MTLCDEPSSKQKHKHKHKNKYKRKHKHKIHTKAKWLEREKKQQHTIINTETERDVQLARQADKTIRGKKSEKQIESYKKNTRKKIFSYIFMFNTHLLLFVYIARYVCVFAISHMLIYSLRSTPQIQARAVSVLHTHSPPLSFARFNPNSLFSHLSELYVCTAKTTEKKEYVEHFIISNTFSRHFVRKKSHNNNEFARHIRIHMKNCFLSSECVPIIMHFHCIKSMPIFFSPSPPVPILLAFLPYSTHAHSQFRWYFERFSSGSFFFHCYIHACYRWKSHCAFYGQVNKWAKN